MSASSALCRHCGEPIRLTATGWWSHAGPINRQMPCDPAKSREPYGLEAEPSLRRDLGATS